MSTMIMTMALCAAATASAAANTPDAHDPLSLREVGAVTLDAAFAAIAVQESGATSAQSQPGQPHGTRDIHIAFTPGVWVSRLGGTAKLGPSPAADELEFETDFDLDDLQGVFNFELVVTKGQKWQIDASGFDFSSENHGVFATSGVFGPLAFAAGDAFESSFDMTSAALEVSYWQWERGDAATRLTGTRATDLRFAWGVGVRWLDVEHTLELPGMAVAPVEAGGEWLVPSLLLRMDLRHDLPDTFPILDAFQVLASGSIGPAIGGGAGGGGVVVGLRAGLRAWFSRNFSADFGYRLLEVSVESDDYEMVGGLQGLFFSATVWF